MNAPVNRTENAEKHSDTLNVEGKRIIVYGMNFSPEIAGVGNYTGEIAEYLNGQKADVTVVSTPPHYPGWGRQGRLRQQLFLRDQKRHEDSFACRCFSRRTWAASGA